VDFAESGRAAAAAHALTRPPRRPPQAAPAAGGAAAAGRSGGLRSAGGGRPAAGAMARRPLASPRRPPGRPAPRLRGARRPGLIAAAVRIRLGPRATGPHTGQSCGPVARLVKVAARRPGGSTLQVARATTMEVRNVELEGLLETRPRPGARSGAPVTVCRCTGCTQASGSSDAEKSPGQHWRIGGSKRSGCRRDGTASTVPRGPETQTS
jgi:hypothetical protein